MNVTTIGSGVPVYRLQEHDKAAQDWALCSFR